MLPASYLSLSSSQGLDGDGGGLEQEYCSLSGAEVAGRLLARSVSRPKRRRFLSNMQERAGRKDCVHADDRLNFAISVSVSGMGRQGCPLTAVSNKPGV